MNVTYKEKIRCSRCGGSGRVELLSILPGIPRNRVRCTKCRGNGELEIVAHRKLDDVECITELMNQSYN